MPSSFSLSVTFLSVVLAGAQAASADVTAKDIWQNMGAYVTALGGELTGQTSVSGDTTTHSQISANFTLPFDAGTIRVTQSGMALREQDDGTVAIQFPPEVTYTLFANITGEGQISAEVIFDLAQMNLTAAGNPGDVAYSYNAPVVTGRLGEWDFPEAGEATITADLRFETVTGNSRITVGDLVATSGRVEIGPQLFTMSLTDANGTRVDAETRVASTVTDASFDLPNGGFNIMNVVDALQDGFRLQAESTVTGYETRQETQVEGAILAEQSSRTGHSTSRFSFDRNGVSVSGEGRDYVMRYLMPEVLPVPIEAAGEAMSAALSFPLEKSEGPQPFVLAVSIKGLSLAEDLWSLFDSEKTIPRDPAEVTLDMSGTMRNLADLMDFVAVGGMIDAGTPPAELHSAELKTLVISGAGAELTGTGAARFDNSDLATYGGFPKPVGRVNLAIKGGDALLTRLVELGVMSEDDAMGARMALAAMAKPDPEAGEDALKSSFEFTEDGGVTANGMRIR